MNDSLPTEMPAEPRSPFQLEHWPASQNHSKYPKRGERTEAEFERALGIARAELKKRRNRMGALTPDQETVIEGLMTSTVTKIADLLGSLMEQRSTNSPAITRTFSRHFVDSSSDSWAF